MFAITILPLTIAAILIIGLLLIRKLKNRPEQEITLPPLTNEDALPQNGSSRLNQDFYCLHIKNGPNKIGYINRNRDEPPPLQQSQISIRNIFWGYIWWYL